MSSIQAAITSMSSLAAALVQANPEKFLRSKSKLSPKQEGLKYEN
jgi:hypothetical protein